MLTEILPNSSHESLHSRHRWTRDCRTQSNILNALVTPTVATIDFWKMPYKSRDLYIGRSLPCPPTLTLFPPGHADTAATGNCLILDIVRN